MLLLEGFYFPACKKNRVEHQHQAHLNPSVFCIEELHIHQLELTYLIVFQDLVSLGRYQSFVNRCLLHAKQSHELQLPRYKNLPHQDQVILLDKHYKDQWINSKTPFRSEEHTSEL